MNPYRVTAVSNLSRIVKVQDIQDLNLAIKITVESNIDPYHGSRFKRAFKTFDDVLQQLKTENPYLEQVKGYFGDPPSKRFVNSRWNHWFRAILALVSDSRFRHLDTKHKMHHFLINTTQISECLPSPSPVTARQNSRLSSASPSLSRQRTKTALHKSKSRVKASLSLSVQKISDESLLFSAKDGKIFHLCRYEDEKPFMQDSTKNQIMNDFAERINNYIALSSIEELPETIHRRFAIIYEVNAGDHQYEVIQVNDSSLFAQLSKLVQHLGNNYNLCSTFNLLVDKCDLHILKSIIYIKGILTQDADMSYQDAFRRKALNGIKHLKHNHQNNKNINANTNNGWSSTISSVSTLNNDLNNNKQQKNVRHASNRKRKISMMSLASDNE